MPWAARNWHTLHDVQFLAPRYSELPGEYTPLGFTAWTNTWLWRFRDVYLTQWKVNEEEIAIDQLPPYAFDSQDEKERMADLLDEYNEALTIDPPLDQEFREIARERTERHPLRTYVTVPLLRTLTLWFTPRVELLPSSGHLWPVREEWQDDRPDFLVTLALSVVNVYLYRSRVGWGLDGAAAAGLGFADFILLGAHAIFCEVRGNAGAAVCAGMFSRGDCARRAGFCIARVN